MGDDEVVKVYRPKGVVTAPETVASFEGKSVCDGHPPDSVGVVSIDTEAEYGRGHAQNVRIGPDTEDDETTLLADLFVKSQPLNDKIDGGVRDISCGYIFNMSRTEDGTIVMTRILGNHIAVVPKGRAGPEISIRDAATVDSESRPKPELGKDKHMAEKTKDNFLGRMLKLLAATDAEPEDLEKVAKMAEKDAEAEVLEKKKAEDAKAFEGKETAEEERKEEEDKAKKAKDEAEAEKGEAELHPDLKKHIEDTRAALDAIQEHLGIKEKEAGEEAAGDADVLEMTGEEQGKTELPKQIGSDADFLRAIRPAVAATKNKVLIDAFNERIKAAKAAAATTDSAYSGLAHTENPHEQPIDDIDPATFFNGCSYAEGKRKLDEHRANLKKGGK